MIILDTLEVLEEKFIGSLAGTHVGDALGMPVEGYQPGLIEMKWGQVTEMMDARLGPGTYTDDTEMMIAVAESLCRCKGFNGSDMARAFVENFNPERGYGGGTTKVLSLIRSGKPWEEAGKEVFNGGSYGNGSAMRVAPVGCLFYDKPQQLKEIARLSSIITHPHQLGIEGAVLQSLAVAKALRIDSSKKMDPLTFLQELIEEFDPQSKEYQDKLYTIERLLMKKPGREEVVKELGNDVRAHNSVPTAVYSFLAFPDNFEEALIYAVNLGGDTDTIGAMTGAISGAYHGIRGIPLHWLEDLEEGPKGHSYIEKLARELYHTYVSGLKS